MKLSSLSSKIPLPFFNTWRQGEEWVLSPSPPLHLLPPTNFRLFQVLIHLFGGFIRLFKGSIQSLVHKLCRLLQQCIWYSILILLASDPTVFWSILGSYIVTLTSSLCSWASPLWSAVRYFFVRPTHVGMWPTCVDAWAALSHPYWFHLPYAIVADLL